MFNAKSSYLEKSVQKAKISRNMTNYTFKPMSYRKNTIEGVTDAPPPVGIGLRKSGKILKNRYKLTCCILIIVKNKNCNLTFFRNFRLLLLYSSLLPPLPYLSLKENLYECQ